MRILGIDTATRKCGYAILEDGKLMCSGVWRLKGDLDERLKMLLVELERLCGEEHPDLVALEVPFVGMNVRRDTAIKLGQAVGIVKGWALTRDIGILEVYPSTAKKAITGSGKASKAEVQAAAKLLYGVEAGTDEADAIAVAVAALYSKKLG